MTAKTLLLSLRQRVDQVPVQAGLVHSNQGDGRALLRLNRKSGALPVEVPASAKRVRGLGTRKARSCRSRASTRATLLLMSGSEGFFSKLGTIPKLLTTTIWSSSLSGGSSGLLENRSRKYPLLAARYTPASGSWIPPWEGTPSSGSTTSVAGSNRRASSNATGFRHSGLPVPEWMPSRPLKTDAISRWGSRVRAYSIPFCASTRL